ncbi:MAG: site-specific integrase [Clostridia bacterium]|nr:site-specific integrase [Clostridia bacterium]
MNELVNNSFNAGNLAGRKIKDLTPQEQNELIQTILTSTPTIDGLTVEQLTKAVTRRNENKIVNDLDRLINIKQIDYESEKNIFLNNVSKTQSKATKDGYFYSLQEIEKYCNLQAIESPLLLTPATADDFIYYLTNTARNKFNKPLAPATVRRNVAGVSSFFTFLARRHEYIKNPFMGTKARPEKKIVNRPEYPNAHELDLILNEITNGGLNDEKHLSNLRKELYAITYFMAYRGIRCGGFENMIITKKETSDGDLFQFETTTKGKTQRGTLPEICITALHNAGIKTTAKEIKPFTNWNSDKVRNYFKYYTNKLYGKDNLIHLIDAPYSCHDLRHYYALQEYQKDKDIYRLKELLNHSSIATTEIYLRSLGVEI